MESPGPSTLSPVGNISAPPSNNFSRERDIFGIVVLIAVLIYIAISIGFSRYIIRYGPKKQCGASRCFLRIPCTVSGSDPLSTAYRFCVSPLSVCLLHFLRSSQAFKMFAKRVFSSTGVPRAMWSTLHIQSARQAAHVLPVFSPIANLPSKSALWEQLATAETRSLATNVETDLLGVIPFEAIIAQMTNILSLLTIFHFPLARFSNILPTAL